jgi:thiol-disulfide isomerase/thioredoxin
MFKNEASFADPGKRKFSLLSVAMLAMLILSACAGAVQSAAEPVEHETASALPADFPITMYQGLGVAAGEQVLLSEVLAEGKPVVLNMWAGLCPPCRLEIPDFQAVHEALGDEVVILGLDVGPFVGLGSNDDGRVLIQELGASFPAGTTPDRGVVASYQLVGMPSTYFIAPDGEVVQRWVGLLTEDKLIELVQNLLAASI